MKNFVKWFGIIVSVTVIGFLFVGCDLINNDYEKLNGVWDRGDIVVTFNDNSATFTQINSDSGWISVQNSGYVKIGDKKFKNITKTDDLRWSCQELFYNTSTYVTGWEDCTITLSANGQTLYSSSNSGTSTYTKK